MQIIDSLKSLVSGLGTAKDKTTSFTFEHRQITDAELNAMHRSDWLARKIVDIIPNDMTREWRDWQAEDDQIELIEALEKAPQINLQPKVNLALQKARLLRGAVIYLGMADRQPDRELNVDRVGQGDLLYLHVLGRPQVTCGEKITELDSPYYGQPSYYEISSKDGKQVRVHPSRIIRFGGLPILDDNADIDGWGDSVLQIVYDAIQNAASAQQHIAALIPEAKTDIIYVPGLSEYASDPKKQAILTNRFSYANVAKSMFNMLLLDGTGQAGSGTDVGEKWEQKQINFAQMPELMQQYLKIAAGAADITLVRLLQDAPSGLGSNGDSAIRSYYDNIAARQRTELQPALNRLDEVIIRSATGKRDPAIHYTWSPLHQMTELEKAEIFERKVNALRTLAGKGQEAPLVPHDALSAATCNMLIEDSTLPGFEAALEESDGLSEEDGDDLDAAVKPAVKPGPVEQD